jgi:tRNA threonylcarbamoyladenosine modification (KEOPS) complex  Pcc1 subunit
MAIDVKVGFTKNPLQLTPKASATSTVKASVNASLRPVNIRNRLG